MPLSLLTGGLAFRVPFPPEVVRWAGDSEMIRLPCEIYGFGRGTLKVSFLKNGNEISMGSVYINDVSSLLRHRELVIEARRGNEGVYQCVGQAGDDGTSTITTSTYVNIQCKLLTLYCPIHIQWNLP